MHGRTRHGGQYRPRLPDYFQYQSTSAAVFPTESSFRQNFDVTGLQPISGRNIIYVVQGAELDIFDTTTDTLAPGVTQIDVVGKAFDVVQIDP